ncbi:MAG TPA: hypothetical protein VGV57_12715 [Thermoleophilaceae bacterium]|nr:hypothetical protein [Thermoleophilaceae bacterium]
MKWFAIPGFGLSLIGAVLAFALAEPRPFLGLELPRLGGITLVFGLALLVISLARGFRPARYESQYRNQTVSYTDQIHSIGGFIAVVVGVVAVLALGVITITQIGSEDKTSMVAVATSAFGVISAVIGAYLGIKIGAGQATDAATAAQKDARALGARAASLESDLETHVPPGTQAAAKRKAAAIAEETAKTFGAASPRRNA